MKIRYILFYLVMAVCHLANANIYQVSDIQIMAEQETTAAARDVAILRGQTDAFWKLMQRMVLPENQEKIPYPNQTELNSWVKTFSLSDEKTTPTKYMARISVQFKPDAIQSFFMDNQIPFLTELMPKTIIIPVFKQDGKTEVFEESSPFFQALKQTSLEGTLFTPTLPMGDLEDITLAHNALMQEMPNWTPLLNKYNATSALVIVMEKMDSTYFYQAEFVPKIYHDEFKISNEFENFIESDILPLAEVNQYILDSVESKWLAEHTNDLSRPLTYGIQISVDNLGVWHAIEQKLKSAEFLENVSVRAFRPKEVIISVQYRGGEDQLNHQLNTIGFELSLSDINDGVLVLLPYRKEKLNEIQ